MRFQETALKMSHILKNKNKKLILRLNTKCTKCTVALDKKKLCFSTSNIRCAKIAKVENRTLEHSTSKEHVNTDSPTCSTATFASR